MPETLLDENAVAALLGVSRRAVQAWRFPGVGPPYQKIGFLVRYRPSAVQSWLDARTVNPERTVLREQERTAATVAAQKRSGRSRASGARA